MNWRSNRHYMITSDQREKLRGWFAGRLPDDLFEELTEVTVDREEITVIGRICEPHLPDGVSAAEREAAVEGRIQEFRERTRPTRMEVAREAEHRFRRKVSWGVVCDGERALFTHVAAPVMTRLRQPERQVLDTLIAGGVARSRSDALAWCVRLVQRHTDDWLTELRESLENVQRVRAQGPDAGAEDRPGDSG
jgi:DNA-binding IclR family transcriptional regulator